MKSTKSGFSRSLIIFGLLSLCTACAEQDAKDDKPAPPEIVKGEYGLIKTLKLSGYTVFAELLEITGISEDITADKTFTCFAPPNGAFNMETVEKIRATPKDVEVRELLKYHLIEGYLPEKTLLISRRVESLNGKYLLFWVADGKVSINKQSDIVKADIRASNGVIHGITKILNSEVPGALP